MAAFWLTPGFAYLRDDTPEQIRSGASSSRWFVSNVLQMSIDDWLSGTGRRNVRTLSLEFAQSPTPWYLVRFKD